MNVLALVLAGHLIGDWVLQTDRQAALKVWVPGSFDRVGVTENRSYAWWRSWQANQEHMGSYHAVLGLLLLAAPLPLWRYVVLLAVSWVTHSFIDRRWPVRWLMAHTGSKPFSETTFGVVAVDQALHLSILCVLVAWLA